MRWVMVEVMMVKVIQQDCYTEWIYLNHWDSLDAGRAEEVGGDDYH
jgi:hypothetical protein